MLYLAKMPPNALCIGVFISYHKEIVELRRGTLTVKIASLYNRTVSGTYKSYLLVLSN